MESLNWSEETTGLCPTCLLTIPARVGVVEDAVWLEQTCGRHGSFRSLLASDSAEYLRLRKYVPDRASGGCCGGESGGCDAGPPVCVLLLEITQACNLRCPTCYADAHGHEFMPISEVRSRFDAFFRRQSRLDVLMLSGGEPTIHPHFEQILETACSYPVDRILVNTNGLRMSQSASLADAIARRRDRVELYLSFAGFQPEVHQRLYGKNLVAEKQMAVAAAAERNIFVNLVPTVERGINESEIGIIYRYALSNPNVSGITYQPVMSAGRHENDYASSCRITTTDILNELENQTDGALLTSDFVGLPCSHPDCCTLTYGLLDETRTHITPLPRHLDVARYLDLFADRISFSALLASAARRVWSDVTHLRARETISDLATLFAQAGVRDAIALRNRPDEAGRRIFRIVIKPFMDAHTFDWKRVEQCCTKILLEGGEQMSFCEYNVLHRGRKRRELTIPLTAVT